MTREYLETLTREELIDLILQLQATVIEVKARTERFTGCDTMSVRWQDMSDVTAKLYWHRNQCHDLIGVEANE